MKQKLTKTRWVQLGCRVANLLLRLWRSFRGTPVLPSGEETEIPSGYVTVEEAMKRALDAYIRGRNEAVRATWDHNFEGVLSAKAPDEAKKREEEA